MSKKKKEEELEEGYARCPISSCTDPIVKEEDMVYGKFDKEVKICVDCACDGN